MSFFNVTDFSNTKETAQCVEVNSKIKEKVRSGKPNENVEIFSKVLFGKDVSKYGKKVDSVMDGIKQLASDAVNDSTEAKAEINAITTIAIQQPLMQRLNINSVMGNTVNVAANEELRYTVYQLQGEMARSQASSGAFPFPTVKKRTGIMETKNATGGLAVDYYELQVGATDGLAQAGEQVITAITNQMVLAHINALRNSIKNATSLKNYSEGITATNVDAGRTKARRFGTNVAILGDFSAVDKLSGLAGFKVNSAGDVRFSEAVMEEVMRTGLLSNYKGSAVVEIPNAYDLTSLNAANTFYAPYLPTTDLWIIPQGVTSPLQIGIKGGLTSMTVNDINTAQEVTRFDVRYGDYVVPEYIPMIGYIYDSSLAE